METHLFCECKSSVGANACNPGRAKSLLSFLLLRIGFGAYRVVASLPEPGSVSCCSGEGPSDSSIDNLWYLFVSGGAMIWLFNLAGVVFLDICYSLAVGGIREVVIAQWDTLCQQSTRSATAANVHRLPVYLVGKWHGAVSLEVHRSSTPVAHRRGWHIFPVANLSPFFSWSTSIESYFIDFTRSGRIRENTTLSEECPDVAISTASCRSVPVSLG